MTRNELNQLVQNDYRHAIRTHKPATVEALELARRVELLERGERIIEEVE